MRRASLLLVIAVLSTGLAHAGAQSDRLAKIARLKALLDAHPGEPRVILKLGEQYTRLADETEQAENMREARKYLVTAAGMGVGPEASAWMGLLRCIEAKYGNGATARSLAQDGLHELDVAVDGDPDNLKYKLMRASVGLKVPREWRRLEQAKDDLLVTELALRRDPTRVKKFELDLSEVYFKLGQAHLGTGELNEARLAWRKARTLVPESRYAREAERLLARHGD